jgi:hypothetical protein
MNADGPVPKNTEAENTTIQPDYRILSPFPLTAVNYLAFTSNTFCEHFSGGRKIFTNSVQKISHKRFNCPDFLCRKKK